VAQQWVGKAGKVPECGRVRVAGKSWGSYSATTDLVVVIRWTRGRQGGGKCWESGGKGRGGKERTWEGKGIGREGKGIGRKRERWEGGIKEEVERKEKGGMGRGREWKGNGWSGRGRQGKEREWMARLGYLSRPRVEFLQLRHWT